jgi:hypothetical protein
MTLKWHHKAFAALAVVPICFFMVRLLPNQRERTFHIFGSEVGFAHIKNTEFLVWGGELVRFPFDSILITIIFVSVAAAIVITWCHLMSRRVDG